MTTIESKKVVVAASAPQVFDFLTDMNNIEKLLPEGKYSDWKSDKTTCSFKVQNAYNIGLQFQSSDPHSGIRYQSTPGTPFPFTLRVDLEESEGKTGAQMVCDADINPFLQMIVKGPLKNLFDYMADRLTVQFPA